MTAPATERICVWGPCTMVLVRKSPNGPWPKWCPEHKKYSQRAVRERPRRGSGADVRRGVCRCECGRPTHSPRPGAPPRSYLPGHAPSSKPCKVEPCELPSYRAGYCSAHKQRVAKYGDPQAHRPVIVRTGKHVHHSGYVVLSGMANHPNAQRAGAIFEHVAVMVEKIGRPLLEHETVHHKNGIRDDNRPENLELWSGRHPKGARVADQISWALEVLATYGADPSQW